jgi:hypothetical protein
MTHCCADGYGTTCAATLFNFQYVNHHIRETYWKASPVDLHGLRSEQKNRWHSSSKSVKLSLITFALVAVKSINQLDCGLVRSV